MNITLTLTLTRTLVVANARTLTRTLGVVSVGTVHVARMVLIVNVCDRQLWIMFEK